jgi:hypothetical protein
VNAKLTVECAAHFHRVEKRAPPNLFEWHEPLPLQFAEVAQTRPGRFIREDNAKARFHAYKARRHVCFSERSCIHVQTDAIGRTRLRLPQLSRDFAETISYFPEINCELRDLRCASEDRETTCE